MLALAWPIEPLGFSKSFPTSSSEPLEVPEESFDITLSSGMEAGTCASLREFFREDDMIARPPSK